MISEPMPPSGSPAEPSPRAVAEFIERAMRDANGLPLAARADFNLLAAKLLDSVDPKAAQIARHTAAFLREADTHQASLFESLNVL